MRLPARSGLSSRANVLALAYAAATAGSVGVFGFSLLSVGIPAAILLALFADGIARPGSSLFYPTVTHGPRTGQRVALSFDDGPDPQVTPAVLDALAQYDARATFFTIGRSLEAHPHLAQRLLAEHHELGNHSWQHSRWQNFRRPTPAAGNRAWRAGGCNAHRRHAPAAVPAADRPEKVRRWHRPRGACN